MLYCPFFSLVVWKQTTPETVVMSRLRCKSWQCPYCAKENRKMWGKHLRKMLPRVSSNWWFVTITAHENTRTHELSLHNIRSNLDRLFKRLNRVFQKINYVRVYEVTKKGAFHAHIVVSGLSGRVQKHQTPQGISFYRPSLLVRGVGNLSIRTYFRRTCRSLGMGYMVDVQAMGDLSKTVGYIVKYLSKTSQDFISKGLRRVQTSRAIGSPSHRGDGSWKVAPRVFRTSVPEGGRLYDVNKRLWIENSYWKVNLTYPKPE